MAGNDPDGDIMIDRSKEAPSGRYVQNRIVEAICRVDLVGLEALGPEVGAEFHKGFQDRFPRLHQLRQLTLTFGASIGKSDEYQGFKLEGDALSVDVSHRAVLVRKLRPYGAWSELSATAASVLKRLREQFPKVRSSLVAARYVNRFELAHGSRLEEYFRVHPALGDLGGALGVFGLRAEIHPEGVGGPVLILQQGRAPIETPGQLPVLLDLDYQVLLPEPREVLDLSGILASVHDGLNRSFDQCITERLQVEFLGGGRQ